MTTPGVAWPRIGVPAQTRGVGPSTSAPARPTMPDPLKRRLLSLLYQLNNKNLNNITKLLTRLGIAVIRKDKKEIHSNQVNSYHYAAALASLGDPQSERLATRDIIRWIEMDDVGINTPTMRQAIKAIRDPQLIAQIEQALKKVANDPQRYDTKALEAAILLLHIYNNNSAYGYYGRANPVVSNGTTFYDIISATFNIDIPYLEATVQDGSLGWILNILALKALVTIGAKKEAIKQLIALDKQINDPHFQIEFNFTWGKVAALIAGQIGDVSLLYLIERPEVSEEAKTEALLMFIQCYDMGSSLPPPDEATELLDIIVSNSPKSQQTPASHEAEEFDELPFNIAMNNGWRIIPGRPPRETPNGLLYKCCRSRSASQNIPPRTIVIDPLLLFGSNRRQVVLTAGTLAWQSIQTGREVILFIGEEKFPIRAAKNTLLTIIRLILNYSGNYTGCPIGIAFARGLKAAKGETLALSSYLYGREEAVAAMPRTGIPVVIAGPDDAKAHEPMICIGRSRYYRLNDISVARHLNDEARRKTCERARALEKYPRQLVAMVDQGDPALVTRVGRQDRRLEPRLLSPVSMVGVSIGSDTIVITDSTRPQPAQFRSIINEIIKILPLSIPTDATKEEKMYHELIAVVKEANEPELLQTLTSMGHYNISACALNIFEFALRNGWPEVLELTSVILKNKMKTATTTDLASLNKLRNRLSEKLSILPDSPVNDPLASRLDWSDIIDAMLHVFLEPTKPLTPAVPQENPADPLPQRVASPINTTTPMVSAVDRAKNPSDQQPWGRVTGSKDRAIYLAREDGLGIVLDPTQQTYSPHPSVTAESLRETGSTTITLEPLIPLLPETALRPCGGDRFQWQGERLITTANTGPLPKAVTKQLGLPLAAFRESQAEENPTLYAAATTADGATNGNWRLVLENPAARQRLGLNAELASEWGELFAGIERDGLSAREAITLIRNYVSQRFHYHHYVEGSLEQIFYQDLMERARNGQCRDEELLAFILQYGGGTCKEMSKIGLSMLRLFGIPCGQQDGWVVGEDGLVNRMGHTWAVALISYGPGKVCTIPVEFSDSCAPADARTEAQAEVAQVIEHQAAIAIEREAQITAKDAARPAIDRFWELADSQTRVKIWRALRELLFIIYTHNTGESESREDMLISQLNAFGRKLSQPANNSELETISKLGNNFIPSRYIGNKLSQPGMREGLTDINNDLIKLWYSRTKSAISNLPAFKTLFRLPTT